MKTIQFTNEEIDNLLPLINIYNYNISDEAQSKFKAASIAPEGSIISIDDSMLIVTPAKAFEKVSERTQAARIENDKRHAKQMIESLERKCEELVRENEALNLQITNN